jgi:hypothetical protein
LVPAATVQLGREPVQVGVTPLVPVQTVMLKAVVGAFGLCTPRRRRMPARGTGQA